MVAVDKISRLCAFLCISIQTSLSIFLGAIISRTLSESISAPAPGIEARPLTLSLCKTSSTVIRETFAI